MDNLDKIAGESPVRYRGYTRRISRRAARIVSGNQGLSCSRDGARVTFCLRFFHGTDVKRSLCSAERATLETLINATSAHFAAISLGSHLHYNVTELIPASIHAVHEVSSRASTTKASFFAQRRMHPRLSEPRSLNSHYKHRINLAHRLLFPGGRAVKALLF